MIKGKFISVWDEGIVTTNATLDPQTGHIDAESVEVGDLGNLIEELFEDENGDEYNVCPECHEYILKCVMEDNPHNNTVLDEVERCSDVNCDYIW